MHTYFDVLQRLTDFFIFSAGHKVLTHVEIFITLTYSVIACSGCVLFRDKRVGGGGGVTTKC